MTAGLARHPALEKLLARVLLQGTWIASAVVAAGLLLAFIRPSGLPPALAGMRVMTAGIALFIMLPVLRVLLMLIVFVRERDNRFAAIAALVLAIIILGTVLGIRMAGGAPG
ncbi:MAG: hypothetical protein B7Z80_24980 [Rhodospirillales bacterium 20-64-7]|nr:MAG: hypothetical protein B7Z80_24980 [Rhodospirillales bacterium 20-64-7]HQT78476.1 DUF1634 domain-containing protein [Rhodopila sp.]